MKEWRSEWKRLIAGLLTVAMVLGNITDISVWTVSAAAPEGADNLSATILSFEELADELKDQKIPTGADESEITFPDRLAVTTDRGVSEQSADTEETGIFVEPEASSGTAEPVDIGEPDPSGEDISVESEEPSTSEQSADTEEELLIGKIADIFLPETLTVYAADSDLFSDGSTGNETDGQTAAETVTLENITWQIDADKSDASTFQSDEASNGYHYTYVPVLPDTVTVTENGEEVTLALTLGEGVALPEIHVLVGDSQAPDISAGDHYDANGFCTGFELNESGQWVKKSGEGACAEETCSGYQPAGQREDGTYEIGNAGQLYWFAGLVNGDEAVCTGDITQNRAANAVLTADITVNTGVLKEDGTLADNSEDFRSWTPIGSGTYSEEANEKGYDGTFDGESHTVSGLYFNDSTKWGIGLFGGVGSGGNISNVNIADSYFYANGCVGAVAGYCAGKSISNCSNAGTINGSSSDVGGIVGTIWRSNITSCFNTGNVSGEYSCIGGIVGKNGIGNINNCFNTGTVSLTEKNSGAGGVCGYTYNGGRITNCYNIGTVRGEGENVQPVNGSVAGYFFANCYYLAEEETDRYEGTTFKTAEQFASGEVAYLLSQGCTIDDTNYDGSAWGQQLGTDSYPVLDSTKKVYWGYTDCLTEPFYSNTGGLSTTVPHHFENGFCTVCKAYQPAVQREDGTYEIGNAGQLYWFAGLVNGDEAVCKDGITQNRAANAVLTADITVNTGVLKEDGTLADASEDFRSWTPIGGNSDSYADADGYEGNFDGGNHTVSGLYFNNKGKSYVGLIGKGVEQKSSISNVNIVDSYFSAYDSVGAVCGAFQGIGLRNCSNAGTVSGHETVGGICGSNGAWKKSILTNCYNTGTVSGYNQVGGVCGSYSNGSITNCYNIGAVSSSGTIGSVYGSANMYSIKNCYYLADKETESSDGTTFKTKEQFASGEVAYLLSQGCTINNVDYDGSVWGQQLGTDPYPVLDSTKKVYWGYEDCINAPVYSNADDVSQTPLHHFENGFCKDCDLYEPATQNEDGTYEIGNAGQLYWFAGLVNGDKKVCTDGIERNRTANAVLTADITVNTGVLKEDGTLADNAKDFRSWTPIGADEYDVSYEGTFNGQNHTVNGLYFDDTTRKYAGLFGGVGYDGNLYNVNLADSYIKANDYAGGICGGFNGKNFTNCSNAGTISGSWCVGGVCGLHEGNNWPAYFNMTECFNTGTVSGSNYVGGVCGQGTGINIRNCYNTGRVSATSQSGLASGICKFYGGQGSITNCFNTGTVSGDKAFDVARLSDTTVMRNCYYLAEQETDSYDGTTFKKADQFASGEVAYLLSQGCTIEANGESITCNGSVWGQDLSRENSCPVLDSTKKVYHGYACLDLVYSNRDDLTQTPGHDFDKNGFCTRCDAYEPAQKAENGVYEIGNAGQLYWFAGLVNGDEKVCTEDNPQDLSAKAVLTADIAVNTGVLNADGTLRADAESLRSWTPIGSGTAAEGDEAKGYSGTFDGQNHTISGLYFDDSNVDEVGLFSHTAENSQVSNMGITDSYFGGRKYVGGISGQNAGKILNCYNAGTVSGDDRVGGISGYNGNAPIANCYNIGIIHVASGGQADGVAVKGTYDTVIRNSYYLDSCAASGTTFTEDQKEENKTAGQFKDGEVAYLLSKGWSDDFDQFDGSVWGQELGVDAYPVLDSTKKVYRGYQDCSKRIYSNEPLSETPAHREFDQKGFCTLCGGYQPAVKNSEGIYEISNAGQLYWFAGLVNGTLDGVTQDLTADAVLTKDITVNSNVLNTDGTFAGKAESLRSWTPMGTDYYNKYVGTFDGQNHTISGLYFDDPKKSEVGLFGSIGTLYISYGNVKNARISNVNIEDSYFHGGSNVGSICGQSAYSTTIENCRNAGTVSGNSSVGGVCGDNGGTIQNCTNTGVISGTDSSIGGISGSDSGLIVNSYNTGAISGSSYSIGGVCGNVSGTVVNSYNTGVVSGAETSSSIGAVCGQNSYGSIVNCYYLEGCAAEGTTFDSTEGESKTEAQFASGEIAYLLDQEYIDIYTRVTYDGAVWGQKLGENGDKFPVFSKDKVYRNETYKGCTGNPGEPEIEYSNTKADAVYVKHADTDKDGKCDICGKQLSNIITGRMLTDAGQTIEGNMTGLDTYPLDAEVTLKVPAVTGYNFLGWYEYSEESPYYTGENLCTSRTYKFAAEADRDLVAVYKPTGNASLTINGGKNFTINGDDKTTEVTATYPVGSQITVGCGDSDFEYWKNSAGMVVSRAKSYTFTVTGQETISAVFNTVAADKATIVFESYYGQIMARDQYAEGATVPEPDLPFRYGYTAIGWDYDGDGAYDETKDTSESALTRAFASADRLVKILPVYQLKDMTYYIIVSDGTGTGEYRQNDIVTAVANDPPRKNWKFTCWRDESGNILSYNRTYQFYASKDMTIQAMYEEDTTVVEAKGTTTMVDYYADTEQKKIIFVSMSTVPEGCTIDKAGVIATDDAAVGMSGDEFNASTAKYVMGDAWNGNAYRYTLSKRNAQPGEIWYARAYLVYTDAEGNVNTVYGDMVSVTMPEE